MAAKRTIQNWFDDYAQYHLNPTNKTIHWICIPLITLCLLGLLWEIPLPAAITSISPWINCATVFVALSLVFYFRLSTTIAIGMAITSGVMLALIYACDLLWPGVAWKISLAVFVLAWIGQFVGHRIEGRKPAFFEDLQFLLIGPAWLLGFIFQRIGVRY